MKAGLIEDILATYHRHGWRLRRALLRPDALATPIQDAKSTLGDAQIVESDFNALWFARPSHAGREAWELRLLSETSYALFEAFEANEPEEKREKKRREMETRMRSHAAGEL